MSASSVFRPGAENPRWRGGKGKTPLGYVRVWAGSHRGKYEHRLIVEQLHAQFPGGPIPEGHEVDHLDHNRAHNCPVNLVLMDERIHHAITADSSRIFWGSRRKERG